MQTPFLRFLLPLCLGFLTASAETQNSEIQGFLQTSAPANTDTRVSPVFGRAPVWVGTLSAVSGNRLNLTGDPGFPIDAYAPGSDTYYVRILSGALAGHSLTVAANDASSLLVDDAGLNLATLAAGDRLELAPYWTLGTLFPAGDAGVSFAASSSPLVRGTELYFYDPAQLGINRAPSASYYFYNGAWRKIGSAVTLKFDGTVVAPDTFVLQRNNNASTTLTMVGRVQPGKIATVIEARSNGQQDNYMAVAYPLPLTLRQLGLGGTPAFVTSASALNRGDELYVYPTSGTGINRPPIATYFYCQDGWRKTGSSLALDFSDSVSIPAGTGFLIRRAANPSASVWVFDTAL